ncbi:MAG: Ig domain-containing protein [Clostridia bacterium]|nr:Ig domain-containing protein [Clostridia bacterium]
MSKELNAGLTDTEAVQAQEEELEKKNKWMYPVLITVLILIFSVGFIYGFRLVLNIEGTYPPAVRTESRTPVPETNEEMAAYLNAVVNTAVSEKPAFSSEWKFIVDTDSIRTTGDEALKNTLVFLADPMENALSGSVEKQATGYGEEMGDKLILPEIEASDIESFTCNYIYYRCRACGNESAEPAEGCSVCGSEEEYQMLYRDRYSISLVLKSDSAAKDRLFKPEKEDILKVVDPALKPYAAVKDLHTDVTALGIYFETDRMTDELQKLTYTKNADVSADLTLVSDGTEAESSVSVAQQTVYSFSWPAVILNHSSLTLAPGKREQITAERICDDPKAYEITWTSSDESVVTVDKKGYVKAAEKIGDDPGRATVTASFTFNGKTYSASCEIIVKVSVEFMEISKHRLTLSPGDTETLTSRVASDNKGFAFKKPTVKTVTWYSADESIATVDANGVITAVAPGETTVFALSDDGYYRSSCTVTVK